MQHLFDWISSHYLVIWTAISTVVGGAIALCSRIAGKMPAPTAESSPEYIKWFKRFNYAALNFERAMNLAHIEDSPNFIAAAEAYHLKRVSGVLPAPTKGN